MRSVIAPESARGGSPVASKLTDVLSVQKREIWSGLLIVGAASAVMAVFLSVYTLRHLAVPIGWDNADYVWRTRLAEVVGIRGIPSGVPAGTFVKQGRPAFLIVAATVSSLSGMSLLLLAMVLPAVTAASMGLASAALLGSASDLDWLDRAAVVLAVGLSINAVLMAEYGYVDNLMMVPVFLVGALAAMLAAEDRRALVGAIVLLGAAGLTHGALFTVAVAVLGLVALSYVPSSWRSWRSGQNLLDTPSMRLGEALAGGIAVAYAALVATASTAPAPRLSRGEQSKKLLADLPRYRFPFALPVAAVGLGSLARRRRASMKQPDRRRFLFTFFLGWSAISILGYLAYRLTKLPVPANRLLLFAPLAMLGVLGAIAARSWIDGRAHLLGAIVLIALVGVSAAVSAHEWLSAPSWLDPVKMGDAEVAVAYLTAASVGPDRPVVFLVDDRGPLPAATVPLMRDEVFDVLPVDRIRHAYVYVGSPQNYLAARPTLIPGNAQYNRISERLFRLMRSTYGQDPVAIIAASFNQTFYWRWEREHPVGRVPGHGVSVLRGPPLPRSIRPAVAPAQPQAPILGAAALSMLGLFGITGLGWLLALFGPRLSSWERMLAAPAAGLAVLVLGGALFDGIGVRLSGVSGALIPLALAVLGWGSYFLLDLRRRSRTPSS